MQSGFGGLWECYFMVILDEVLIPAQNLQRKRTKNPNSQNTSKTLSLQTREIKKLKQRATLNRTTVHHKR